MTFLPFVNTKDKPAFSKVHVLINRDYSVALSISLLFCPARA